MTGRARPGRVVAIIQARLGSSRLPGKVLLPLSGRTLLAHVVERTRRARGVDEVRVATSDRSLDDPIVHEAAHLRVPVTRGPEQDVLARYQIAARESAASIVVRITADCPLLAPEVVERTVNRLLRSGADYASNTLARSFPRGLDVEALRREVLDRAADEATAPPEREHVTPFVWQRPERFRLESVRADPEEEGPDLRVTVDQPMDYAAVCAIAQQLPGDDLSARALLRVLRGAPWLSEINASVEQKPL